MNFTENPLLRRDIRYSEMFTAVLAELTHSDWNVFIEGPPHGKSDPAQVLKYLARYMTGGPISDRRIIRDEKGQVTFWARGQDKAGGNPLRPFADRRHAQNGADASSLAGGGAAALYMENNYVDYEDFNCSPNDYPDGYETWQAQNLAKAAAISRAGDNDFTIDEIANNDNGLVETSCSIHDTGGRIDKYVDITTTITAHTQTKIAHFIYNGPLRNTVRALTRVRPKVPFGLGYAIVTLRPDCPTGSTGGVNFNGNNTVRVYGTAFTDEESDIIKERLSGLGYID